jgi:hypothetical protein
MAKIKLSTRSLWALLAFELIALSVIGIIVWQGLKPPESSLSKETPINQQAEVDIESGQAFIMSLLTGETIPLIPGDVLVYVPGNAVTTAGKMAITTHNPTILADGSDPDWVRLQVVNIEIKDDQGRLSRTENLSTPIEICFSVGDNVWRDYKNRPDDYQVQYYSETPNGLQWRVVPKKDYIERQQICGLTDHLSFFALAVKAQPSVAPVQPEAKEAETATPTLDVTETPGGAPTETIQPTPTLTPTQQLPIGS